MKNVGIMSMQRIINYGSFLQAFALSNTIRNLGHEVQFVDFKIEPCARPPFVKLTADKVEEQYRKNFYEVEAFENKFKNEFLKELNVTERNERPELDTLVVGSDEVFNCLQTNPDCGYSLELFGKDHRAKKLITYAACCGATTYNQIVSFGKQDEITPLLNQFDKISVRDENTREFVSKLSTVEPINHLDPVLIYDFSKDLRPVKVDLKDYIIVYAYSFNLTDDECAKIREFADKHNKKIVCVGSFQKCMDIFVDAHPLEVFSYFKDAFCVITNTFHGTIFSIKSHTPFVSFIRDYNGEKMLDLLNRLNLNDRLITSLDDIESTVSKKIDFDKIDEHLLREREKSIEYLKNNI